MKLQKKWIGHDTALKLIQKFNSERELVAATFTQRFFTVNASSTGRIEGFFGGVKKDISTYAMANYVYAQVMEHLTTLSNSRSQRTKLEMTSHLKSKGQLDWNPSINQTWLDNNANVHLYSAKPLDGSMTRSKYEVTDRGPDPKKWNVEIDESKKDHATCTCLTFTCTLIPCVHICCVLTKREESVFAKHIIASRWRLSSHPMYELCKQELAMRVGQFPATSQNVNPVLPVKSRLFANVPVPHAQIQRTTAMQNIFEEIMREAERSQEHYQWLMNRLTCDLHQSAAMTTSDAAQANEEALAASDDIRMPAARPPPTKRELAIQQGIQKQGRPATEPTACSQSLATIKQNAARDKKDAKRQLVCSVCDKHDPNDPRKFGHQKNNQMCPTKNNSSQASGVATVDATAASADETMPLTSTQFAPVTMQMVNGQPSLPVELTNTYHQQAFSSAPGSLP